MTRDSKNQGKINNMSDLREATLETIERLRSGDIDISEAQTMAKLCDSVIHTVNSQYSYAKIIGETPSIPFMEKAHQIRHEEDGIKIIEGRAESRLEQLKN